MVETMETETAQAKPLSDLVGLIEEGDIAMLTTVSASGQLHTRPMETCYIGGGGELYFFTTLEKQVSEEIRQQLNVGVSYVRPEDNFYVAVSGKVEIITTDEAIASYWQEKYSFWIPGGLTDPNLVLLKVTPKAADSWHVNTQRHRVTQSQFSGGKSRATIVNF